MKGLVDWITGHQHGCEDQYMAGEKWSQDVEEIKEGYGSYPMLNDRKEQPAIRLGHIARQNP
jgi:hypothetical protein